MFWLGGAYPTGKAVSSVFVKRKKGVGIVMEVVAPVSNQLSALIVEALNRNISASTQPLPTSGLDFELLLRLAHLLKINLGY